MYTLQHSELSGFELEEEPDRRKLLEGSQIPS